MEIEFCSGLNIVTGETGAGKSVMLNGLNFIIGARCSKSVVRFGEKYAFVEAVFENPSSEIIEILKKLTIKIENDKILTVKRLIYDDGRSKALINSSTVSIGDLKQIGQKLVNFNEQSSSQNILHSENNIRLLDSFAEINELVASYRKKFIEFNNILKKLKQINSTQNIEKFKELKAKVSEIEKANIKPDEELKINEQLKLIQNSANIFDTLNSIYEILTGNYENEGILSSLKNSTQQFEKINEFSDELKAIYEKFTNLTFELEEISFEIEKLKSNLNFDPKQLEFLENRLSVITKLKRKFGPNFENIENNLKYMKLELEKMQTYSAQENELTMLKNKKIDDLKKQLLEISKKREEAASEFSKYVLNELKFLEMKHSNFVVKITKHKANLNGLEDIEFLISANAGEPLKPLCKVASGGELSRITLAIVSIMNEKFKQSTLVFDEIDSGVSGIAAKKIGIKLKQLSNSTQIICITHLAQIASIANKHFKIFKSKDGADGRVSSKILNLNFDEKVKEVARLIDGNENSELTLSLAGEMIKQNSK